MTRSIVVGGFASSQEHVDRVVEGLSHYYDHDFDGVSFREAMADPGKLERMVRRRRVFTHSAGMLAIKDTMPSEIIAIAPPLPTAQRELIARAILSCFGLAASSLGSIERRGKVNECGRDAAVELLFHMNGNLGRLGMIAGFSALEMGAAASEAGVTTNIAFMDKDWLFRPPNKELTANIVGVTMMELTGHHDELLCYPERTIAEFEMKRATTTAALVG